MKRLERLLFLQGHRCFFCDEPIAEGESSVEHLVATANGGPDDDENCVACCRTVNALLGCLPLKAKLAAILRHRGRFACPGRDHAGGRAVALRVVEPPPSAERLDQVVADLRKRGQARPRSLTTLRNTVNAVFRKTLTDEELDAMVVALRERGYVSIAEDRVAYALPPAE
jgi:hypothetical protein